jgi:hypothetical protein
LWQSKSFENCLIIMNTRTKDETDSSCSIVLLLCIIFLLWQSKSCEKHEYLWT